MDDRSQPPLSLLVFLCTGWRARVGHGRQPMRELWLRFADGAIDGAGSDIIGRFSFASVSLIVVAHSDHADLLSLLSSLFPFPFAKPSPTAGGGRLAEGVGTCGLQARTSGTAFRPKFKPRPRWNLKTLTTCATGPTVHCGGSNQVALPLACPKSESERKSPRHHIPIPPWSLLGWRDPESPDDPPTGCYF